MNKERFDVRRIVGLGVLTAIVIVLQMVGAFVRFGPFSISLTLAPIVIGAALYGPVAGAWLGLVFGVVVLFNDSAPFLAVSALGTAITVLLKGILCGFVSGLVYRALCKKNVWLAAIAAAIVCPVVNTGIFVIGCFIWFMPTIAGWGAGLGFEDGISYLFLGMIGINFLIELGINIVLSSVIVKILAAIREN